MIIGTYYKIYIKQNGSNTITLLAGSGSAGNTDGNGSSASLRAVVMVIDSNDNIYIVNTIINSQRSTIRKINLAGDVSTVAGGVGVINPLDGNGLNATFSSYISSMCIDNNNNIYLCDNQLIRKINTSYDVTTISYSSGLNANYVVKQLSYYNNYLYIMFQNNLVIVIKKLLLSNNTVTDIISLPSIFNFNLFYVISSGIFEGTILIILDYNIFRIDSTGKLQSICGDIIQANNDYYVVDGIGSNAFIDVYNTSQLSLDKLNNFYIITRNSSNKRNVRKVQLLQGSVMENFNSVFSGYLLVDNTTNIVSGFFNNNNPSANILAFTNDDYSANYNFVNGNFGYNGLTITSISSAIDTQYGATEWDLWGSGPSGVGFSYKDSNGNWTDLYITPLTVTTSLYTDPSNYVPCFNQGTKILCLNKEVEEYVPVQNLRKGDIVKTYLHGYKQIKEIGVNRMINDPSNHRRCMYVMKKDKNVDLVEDLTVTGDHSILVDVVSIEERTMLRKRLMSEEKIGQKKLVMSSISDKFEQIVNRDEYTYYHFCVEDVEKSSKKFGVWANGVLSEIPAADQFKSLNLQIV